MTTLRKLSLLLYKYMLLSLFPSSYLIWVYFIIPTFGVESILHYSKSFLFLNKCAKTWRGHYNGLSRSIFNEEFLQSQMLGELWAGRLQQPASSGIALVAESTSSKITLLPGCPNDQSVQEYNVLATSAEHGRAFNCGVS